jgi:hypothetical protein
MLRQGITNPSTNEAIENSCISPRGGRGSSVDIKGIFGFKCRRIALNMLPKKMLRQGITNPSTNEAIEIYKMDRNYPRF